MTIETTMPDHVRAIAEDVFAVMIDGEEGILMPGDVAAAEIADPVSAWVEVHGSTGVRAVLTAGEATGERLAAAMMTLHGGAGVTPDRDDALGEVANVIGGNLKAVIPETRSLSLPEVDNGPPPDSGVLTEEVRLSWRGSPIAISLWNLTTKTEGEY